MREEPSLPSRFGLLWSTLTLLTFAALGATMQVLHLAWGLWASEVLFFAGLAVIGWQLTGVSARAALGLERFEGRSFALGAAYGTANYLAWAIPLMALAQAIFPKRLVELFDSARIFERHSQLEVLIVVAGATLAAPVCEEIFFRGFLQRSFAEAPRGIVVTAVVFSAFHMDPVGFLARFELGVLFGLLAWRARSIWPAIGAHLANNTVSSVLYFVSDKHDDAELDWRLPLVTFAIGNLALFALARFTSVAAEAPARLLPVERKSPGALLAPWLVLGAASLSLLLALDWRGVALNVIDLRAQPAETLRDATKTLRAQARAGDVPLREYEARVTTP